MNSNYYNPYSNHTPTVQERMRQQAAMQNAQLVMNPKYQYVFGGNHLRTNSTTGSYPQPCISAFEPDPLPPQNEPEADRYHAKRSTALGWFLTLLWIAAIAYGVMFCYEWMQAKRVAEATPLEVPR